MINLQDLAIETREVELDFPGFDDFKVKVAHVSRHTSAKIHRACQVTKFDKKSRLPYQELDQDKFLEKFCKEAIVGWSGLTYRVLDELMLINVDGVKDLDEEIDYSLENAITLMRNSVGFDNWIKDTVFELDSFRNTKE
jgi:hypothetical protein